MFFSQEFKGFRSSSEVYSCSYPGDWPKVTLNLLSETGNPDFTRNPNTMNGDHRWTRFLKGPLVCPRGEVFLSELCLSCACWWSCNANCVSCFYHIRRRLRWWVSQTLAKRNLLRFRWSQVGGGVISQVLKMLGFCWFQEVLVPVSTSMVMSLNASATLVNKKII